MLDLVFSLRLFRLQGAVTQGTLLHEREKHGHENQHVNRRRNHAAHERRGYRFHDVGADTALPQNGNQARQDDADRHEFGSQAMHGSFDNGFLDVLVTKFLSTCEPPVQRFVKIDNHDHAGLDGNAEQRDVADPHCDAEVVAKQFLENQAARERIKCREDEHHRLCDGMKHHVEEDKDHEEYDGQDNLQPFFGSQFELVLSRPLETVACGQVKSLFEDVIGFIHEVAVIPRFEIYIDVARERTVFVPEHGRTTREGNACDLFDWDLCAGGCSDQISSQLVYVVPKIAAVTDVDGIAFAAFDVFSDHRAADS